MLVVCYTASNMSDEKSEAARSGVMVSPKSSEKLGKRTLFWMAIGGVVVLLAVATWFAVKHYHNSAQSKGVATDQVVKDVNQKLAGKNYKAAEEALKNAKNPDDKQILQLGAKVAEDQGQYYQAQQKYQRQEQKYGIDYDLAIAIAQTAEKNIDWRTALTYDQKALVLLKQQPEGPTQAAAKAYLNSDITRLTKLING